MKRLIISLVAFLTSIALSSCMMSNSSHQTTKSITDITTTRKTSQSSTLTPTSSKKKIGVVVNVNKSVNIRSKPTTESDIVGKVSNGTQLIVLTEFYNDNWHEIEYEGQSAFIHKEYFDVDIQNPVAQTSETTNKGELGSSKSNPIIISASQLVKEVDKDWEKATQKYKGKYLQVTGKIVYISRYSDLVGYYFVNTLDSGKTRVVVWFDPPFPNCNKGDTITAIGLCQSAENSTEIIYCSLVD